MDYGPNGVYNDRGKAIRIEGRIDTPGRSYVPHSRRKRPLIAGARRAGGVLGNKFERKSKRGR